MFQRRERAAAPEEIAAFRGRVRLTPTAAMVAGSLLAALSAAVAISLVLAAVKSAEPAAPPKPAFAAVWLAALARCAPLGAAAGLALAFVMAWLGARWRLRRTPRRVTETVATADLAVAVWGLAEGELDALFLRVEPDQAWIIEAGDFALTPDDTTIPERTRRVVSDKGLFVAHECSGLRRPLRAVEADQGMTESLERVLDRVVPIAELPGPIRRVLLGGV